MTLAALLGEPHRLRIPDYQRSYAWTVAEAGQLLDDIVGAAAVAAEVSAGAPAEPDDYFLGAVVLMGMPPSEPGDSPGGATHEIVDGLQRLVTVTIMLAVLRDLTAADAPAAARRAMTAVQGEGAARVASGGDVDGGGAPWRLELQGEAQAFFAAFVQAAGACSLMPADEPAAEAERRLIEVREHFVTRLVDEPADRLARLADFVLDRCHCAVITARSIDTAHRIFSVLNDRGRPLRRGDILKAETLGGIEVAERGRYRERWEALERRLGGSLDELLGHLRSVEGRPRARIIDDVRAIVRQSGGARAFVDGLLLPYGEILERIRAVGDGALPAGGGAEADIALRIAYLDWLGSSDWVAPLMLWWRSSGAEPVHLAAMLARLDRLAYAMRLLGLGADKRARRYQALVEAIRQGNPERSGSPLDLTRDEQRLITYNLRNLHERSQLACKLLLLRLNDEIAGGPQRLDPARLTVEHVLPQKPSPGSRWRAWFAAPDVRERCTQSLGNLILVSRDMNEKARNLDLDAKLAIYFADRDQVPHITRELASVTEWRPEHVLAREERLFSIIQRLWQIGPGRAV